MLVDLVILAFLALFLAPNLRLRGRAGRALDALGSPAARFGLWHRWSMYSPEVPRVTRLGLVGIRLADGSFEAVPLSGLDDGRVFGKARGLRFISFQWALTSSLTDPLKPALCERALAQWRAAGGARSEGPAPVAVELRELTFPSPPAGERVARAEPEARVLHARPIEA